MEIEVIIALFFAVFATSSVACAYWFGEHRGL
jgi:hypothetical protein